MEFKIFKHPSGTTEAVKQGWSWPAFFFTGIWAFVKGMWKLGGGLLLFFFAIALIRAPGELGDGLFENVALLVISVVLGVNGNSLRGKNLTMRGFDHVDTTTAATSEGAMAAYLKKQDSEMKAPKLGETSADVPTRD